jgi:hypothetical protein
MAPASGAEPVVPDPVVPDPVVPDPVVPDDMMPDDADEDDFVIRIVVAMVHSPLRARTSAGRWT